ncbi:RraA family protein [Candidatus Poribacteria bacterium]|jgi:4-hydroxy-4-methyl-2-oxoglutarate aldolase|nr:RraA family protein [Candidatus Poribacteria bacterium]MBT5531660.1 RraA family protein [Candidatus Poribacteria bacterium]MBT5709485.1 RraA family protein [Candidatus Poribacteria bacterium]MBT7099034.1 RraA family protein [Candidatus Poribacteria bacterium]MBT7807169.1 RraA family protein [Candidatus Poribacteria bacterium]
MALSTATLEKLVTFDTPTICNIIELFDVRPRNTGYMDGRIRACFPEMPPIVGFASTATFRSNAAPRAGDAYSGMDDQVAGFGALSGPPIVVFQDVDDPTVAATFGEVMCTTYQAFGAAGLITSGAGRDLDQVRDIGFPAFTDGTICAHGYCHFPQVGVPVHVGGITIFPDDMLHADVNGVTTIPVDIAAEVADVGDEFVGAEVVVLEALRAGTPSVETLRDARRESGEIVARLREQVARSVGA